MLRIQEGQELIFLYISIGDGLASIEISTKNNELISDNANWAEIHAAADAIIQICVSASAAQGGRAIEVGWSSPLSFPFLSGFPQPDRPTSHETSKSNPELMLPPLRRPRTPHSHSLALRQ